MYEIKTFPLASSQNQTFQRQPEAENLILRQQLVVLRRKFPKRVRLWNIDRLLLVWLYRLYPSFLDAIIIVQPETVIPLAPTRFPCLLALEVPPRRRSPTCLGRRPHPSTVKAGRNRLITNNEVRPHSLNRTARLRFRISAEELFIERADLHFGESRSETEVLTGSEPDMRRLRTSDVKAIWIGEDRFVTITRAIPEDYLVARTD